MAVEAKRGCGYRKVGGLYLAGSGLGIACDRLPVPLHVCPTCSHGIKPTRGFTWVDLPELVGGPHTLPYLDTTPIKGPADIEIPNVAGKRKPCRCKKFCPLCKNPAEIGRAGLLWIGEQFYKNAEEFEAEARTLGVSRRIATIPRGFELGKTWILFAHRLGLKTIVPVEIPGALPGVKGSETKYEPAIFRVWKPERIEQICTESQRGTEEIAKLEKRGITPVFVPDNDPDHKGKDSGMDSEELVEDLFNRRGFPQEA